MTREELALVQALRMEMNQGLQAIRDDISKISESQAAHLAVHDERERQEQQHGVSKRWVIGVVAASTLTIVSIVLGGIYHFLGI